MSKKKITPKLGGHPFDRQRLRDFHSWCRFLEREISDDFERVGATFPNKAARTKAIKMLAWNVAFFMVTK